MKTLIALILALPLLAFAGLQPARAQCVNGLLSNCPAAVGLGLNDFIWADQASQAPHTSRKATPAQLLALAPSVYPMLSGVTIGGDCAGSGTAAITLTCSLAASKITSGTLAGARLPAPLPGVFGGVTLITAPANQFLTGIPASGIPTFAPITSAAISDASPMSGTDVSNALGTGAAPTVSACGTSPAVVAGSTDFSGNITVGSGTVTACTITFAGPHSPKPTCTISPLTAIAAGVNPSTTNFVAAFAASVGSSSFGYSCL